jgi:uncharacterized membrane protein
MLAVDIVEIAVAKLGFSPSVAGIVLALVILGSTINIPLYRVESPTVVAENFTRDLQRNTLPAKLEQW